MSILLKNRYLKSFIIFFSFICSLVTFSVPQRANAFVPFIIAGVVVTEEVVTAAVGATLVGGSCVALSQKDIQRNLARTISDSLDSAHDLVVSTGEAGQKIISLSAEGMAKIKASLNDLINAGSFVMYGNSVVVNGIQRSYSASDLISVGTYNGPCTITATFSDGHVESSYFKTGSSVTKIRNASTSKPYCIQVVGDNFINGSSTVAYTSTVPISATITFDGSISADSLLYDDKVNDLNDTVDYPRGIPVSVSADGTSYIPTPDVTVPDIGIPIGSIDVPIDTPVDTPIDTGGTIDTDTGVMNIPILGDILKILQKILAFLGTLIASFVTALVTALTQLATSLFVPTDSFFTDQFNKIKIPIMNKFPNNLDILKSLEVDGDTFNDIPITIMGSTGIIVSASYVHKYISYIRGATSCFWIFLLVMYLWRKINAFVSGNEIIQPNVRNGGNGKP